jgi:DNA-binding PadR family transcriptional regulator
MNKVSYLGELECMLLLVVLKLGDEAYGLSIREELARVTGRAVARGAAYVTLDRLEQKGYLRSRMGAAEERRAGRPRRYFTITPEGTAAVQASRDALERLWSGVATVFDRPS